MKQTLFSILFVLSFAIVGFASNKSETKSTIKPRAQIKAANAVLERTLGKHAAQIRLKLDFESEVDGVYEYECADGKLTVRGNSPTTLTRGVYDYLQAQYLGMLGWEGPSFTIPNVLPAVKRTRVRSPFKIRQAYNVVTFGYTMPYWDWARWEQELDWQAMHGFNMLLAPIATEAIATRVWQKLGLTQAEIDEFYVGPAHLPWQRMGNISNVGGTLPAEWHLDQIALQKKVLKRMRELKITPVVQSFAGFVPKALKRIYPDIELHKTLWHSGFPEKNRPVLLMPDDSLFAKITQIYMDEWQSEFGKESHYLVDSFNEMELPATDQPVTDLLSDYGERTFKAIQQGNKEAVWVIQGWMFAYQKHIWTPERVKALFSKVPDNKTLILDYANDYANNWEPMNGFNGKQWVYGFVPNMGGKTPYTGDMELYASGSATALASPIKNNLVGYSISGEGLENNQVLYELMTDAAWSEMPIELDSWLEHYSVNRYGDCPPAITESWNLLRKSAYSTLMDHPRFGWQQGRLGFGTVNRQPQFNEATALFLSCSDELGSSPNYVADAIERTAISLGLRADEWFRIAELAYSIADLEAAQRAGNRGLEILDELDRLLESHPLNRLDRWLELSQKHSTDPKLNKFYESNARQIVSIWGPPVNDYSSRLWSGLVRDYYRVRMAKILESLFTGIPFDKAKWELDWVQSSGISQMEVYEDPLKACKQLFDKAINDELPLIEIPKGESIGTWSAATVNTEWKTAEWEISAAQLKSLHAVAFVYTSGLHRLDIQEVSVIADGKVVAHKKQFGYAGAPSNLNYYYFKLADDIQGNNGCSIRALVRSNGGGDSKGRVELIRK